MMNTATYSHAVKLPAPAGISNKIDNCTSLFLSNLSPVVFFPKVHNKFAAFLKYSSNYKNTMSRSVVVLSSKSKNKDGCTQCHSYELDDGDEDIYPNDDIGEDGFWYVDANGMPSNVDGGHFSKEDLHLYSLPAYGAGAKLKLALETGMDDTICIDMVSGGLTELISAKVKRYFPFDGNNIKVGDVLIGLPSNEFSLLRRVLEPTEGYFPETKISLVQSLLAPIAFYTNKVLDVISKGNVKGIVHNVGGGLTENIPRVLPPGFGAVINTDSWVVPPVYNLIQQWERIDDDQMRRDYNMGIGMVFIVSRKSARRILRLSRGKFVVHRIGEVLMGDGVIYRRKTKGWFTHNVEKQRRLKK